MLPKVRYPIGGITCNEHLNLAWPKTVRLGLNIKGGDDSPTCWADGGHRSHALTIAFRLCTS